MSGASDKPLGWWGRRRLELSIWWRPWPWERGSVVYDLLLHPGIWIPLLLLHLVTVWWALRMLGAPLLFWHDDWVVALVAGITTALTFGWGMFLFFFLDYSAWLERRDRIREWVDRKGILEQTKAEGGTGARGDYLPSEPHWTNRLYREFRRRHPKVDDQGEDDPVARADSARLTSFFYCSLTNGLAWQLGAILLLRILFVSLMQEPLPPPPVEAEMLKEIAALKADGAGSFLDEVEETLQLLDKAEKAYSRTAKEAGTASAAKVGEDPAQARRKQALAAARAEIEPQVVALRKLPAEEQLRRLQQGEEGQAIAKAWGRLAGAADAAEAESDPTKREEMRAEAEAERFLERIEAIRSAKESVRFVIPRNPESTTPWWKRIAWGMWTFVLGLIAGSVLVVAINRLKFRLLPASWLRRLGGRSGSRELRMLRAMASWGGLAVLAVYGGLAAAAFRGAYWAAPALCVLAGVIMGLYAWLAYLVRRHVLTVGLTALAAAGLCLALVWKLELPRYRYAALDKVAGEDVARTSGEATAEAAPEAGPASAKSDGGPRVPQRLGMLPILSPKIHKDETPAGKLFPAREAGGEPQGAEWEAERPLVIVCTSGGGITAAVWTVDMLSLLSSQLEGFAESVRIITGASGGMVGGAAWAALQKEYGNLPPLADPQQLFGEEFVKEVQTAAQTFGDAKVRAWLKLGRDNTLDETGLCKALIRCVFSPYLGEMEGHKAWLEPFLTPYQRQRARVTIWELLLRGRCREDQLSPVVVRGALWDMTPLALFLQKGKAKLRGLGAYSDRGNALEAVWTDRLLPELGKKLGELAEHERTGNCPSLIFAPMLAEDGRQLLASNLDLHRLTVSDGRVVSALEARPVLGQPAIEDTTLSSWARMSASFPLITPPGTLRVRTIGENEDVPERTFHLLDAGYADNYGTRIALEWLRKCWLPWLREEKSQAPKRVLLIELDAYPRYGDEGWHFRTPSKRQSPCEKFWAELRERGREVKDLLAEDVAMPLAGLGQRGRLAGLRNEEGIDALRESLERTKQAAERFAGVEVEAVRFVNPVPASLNWTLSQQERETLEVLSGELAGFLRDDDNNHIKRNRMEEQAGRSPVAAATLASVEALGDTTRFWRSSWRACLKQRILEGREERWKEWRKANQETAVEAAPLPAEDHSRPAGTPFTNGLGMELVWCRPGTFTMGEDSDAHPVTLTRGFWTGKHEVTQGQWYELMKEGAQPDGLIIYEYDEETERKKGTVSVVPSHFLQSGPDAPVEGVNWYDAMEFCRRLTHREAAAGRLPPDWEYTLPTEAQWEYACRAGTDTPFAVGDGQSLTSRKANIDGDWPAEEEARWATWGRTVPVGRYPANAWGIHDMDGSVWEWCRDWWDEKYDAKPEAAKDPRGPPSGSGRVYRGGSRYVDLRYGGSADSDSYDPEPWDDLLGFRVAAVPIPSSPEISSANGASEGPAGGASGSQPPPAKPKGAP